jgi:hypothetical protein
MAIPDSAEHRTVHVALGDQQADVDKEIAPLVKGMWRAGIMTSQSCQDCPPGWIWLEFLTPYDLEKFLNILGAYEDTVGSLHDRILHGYDRLGSPRVGQWRYEAIVHDMAVDIVDDGKKDREQYAGAPDFAIYISLNFPGTDLPAVLKRIQGFNRKQARAGTAAQKHDPTQPHTGKEAALSPAAARSTDGDVAGA